MFPRIAANEQNFQWRTHTTGRPINIWDRLILPVDRHTYHWVNRVTTPVDDGLVSIRRWAAFFEISKLFLSMKFISKFKGPSQYQNAVFSVYRNFFCKDSRSSYLYNAIAYTWKIDLDIETWPKWLIQKNADEYVIFDVSAIFVLDDIAY